MFFWPRTVLTGQVGARIRSTGRSTDVHRAVHVCWHSGPVDRSVDRTREPCSLYLGGRPGGQPDQRALLSVSGRSTRLLQRSYLWPLAVDRKPVRLTDQPNDSILEKPIYTPFLGGFNPDFLEQKFSHSLVLKISFQKCLKQVLKRVFGL